jgi:2-polyprenyl-3-methyl-5-hydroxy-6-metoxy-1,4-benzoquinol methylase
MRSESIEEPVKPSSLSREQYDGLWRDLWANCHAGGPMARTRYRLALQWLDLGPDSHERMLDVGAGNGAFMAGALKRAPALALYGAEFSQAAIQLAHPDMRERIARCDLQAAQPLPWGGNFQTITCMEVLEHLADDALALKHIANALAPGGRLLISVPAWESRWGPQDVAAGHVRRYEPHILRERVEQAGLTLTKMRCWGGPFAYLYLRAADLVTPEKVMKVRPTGIAGLAAAAIFHVLKLDDYWPAQRGEQLLALAVKGAR